MSRSPAYQKLLNSKRWRELRARYREAHPLCERCLAEGRVSPTVDIHHVKPVEGEGANDLNEMKARCFDWNNIQALCVACHIEVHQQERSHSKEQVQANKQRETQRWLDRWLKK